MLALASGRHGPTRAAHFRRDRQGLEFIPERDPLMLRSLPGDIFAQVLYQFQVPLKCQALAT